MKEITLEEAQKFIKRWGMSSDLYITQNIEYDMNGGDPTDNSIKLSNEHEEMLHKVVEAGMKANSGAGVSYMPFPDDRSRLYAALRCIETTIGKNKADWWKIEKINKIIAECKRPLKRKGI